jgi:alpha,alpha-trehalase
VVRIRTRAGHVVELNRYFSADAHQPRPESWPEDRATAEAAAASSSSGASSSIYRELATAAESGWDFSSRWIRRGNDLSNSQPTRVVPVDLNAMLFRMESNLHRAHSVVALTAATAASSGSEPADGRQRAEHHSSRADLYEAAAARRAAAIEAVLWQESDGRWRDAWLREAGEEGAAAAAGVHEVEPPDADGGPRPDAVFLSDFLPMWAGLASQRERSSRVLASFLSSGLISAGGVSTSNLVSGQQWDSPNAWPPLQAMIVEGLEKAAFAVAPMPRQGASEFLGAGTAAAATGSDAQQVTGPRLAFEIARLYLSTARAAFEASGFMFEKYDATALAKGGGGGEYEQQVGFGWSNGAALYLLKRYGAAL